MAEDLEQVIVLTADIVAAHVSNNNVAVGDLPVLIANVHAALSGLGRESDEQAQPQRREPAVSVRSSVKPDAITCLIDGSKHKMLKRHLANAHGLTPQQYRDEFGLKADYPMVAPNYAEQRRALAHKIGLGRKPRSGGDAPAAKEKAPARGRRKKSGARALRPARPPPRPARRGR